MINALYRSLFNTSWVLNRGLPITGSTFEEATDFDEVERAYTTIGPSEKGKFRSRRYDTGLQLPGDGNSIKGPRVRKAAGIEILQNNSSTLR